MTVLDKIYEAYLAGELSPKPISVLAEHRGRISELEERLNLDEDQREELEQLILNIACGSGEEMFKIGFNLAGQLYSHTSA